MPETLNIVKAFFLEGSRLTIDIILARQAGSSPVESADIKTAAQGTSSRAVRAQPGEKTPDQEGHSIEHRTPGDRSLLCNNRLAHFMPGQWFSN